MPLPGRTSFESAACKIAACAPVSPATTAARQQECQDEGRNPNPFTLHGCWTSEQKRIATRLGSQGRVGAGTCEACTSGASERHVLDRNFDLEREERGGEREERLDLIGTLASEAARPRRFLLDLFRCRLHPLVTVSSLLGEVWLSPFG